MGSDFDARFLDWLFDTARDIQSGPEPPAPSHSPSVPAQRSVSGGSSRLLNNALAPLSQPEKRKLDDRNGDSQNKRRISDGVPSGPRGMGNEGRSLADRLGPNRGGGRGGFQVRGMAGGRPNNQGGFAPGFRQQPMGGMQPGFGGFYQPGQQEMMAQMMMMQASMAQMGQMMSKMNEVSLCEKLSLISRKRQHKRLFPHLSDQYLPRSLTGQSWVVIPCRSFNPNDHPHPVLFPTNRHPQRCVGSRSDVPTLDAHTLTPVQWQMNRREWCLARKLARRASSARMRNVSRVTSALLLFMVGRD